MGYTLEQISQKKVYICPHVKCGYQEFFYPVGIVFEIISNPADQSRRQSKPYTRH
ncbi:MAG: hypothetical protein [Bacteriophage sp.]|nr:MAG: hypothetical protein [Bacteriophage sp.]